MNRFGVYRFSAAIGLLAIGLAMAGLSCRESDDTVEIAGEGATFPAILYQQWFKDFNALHSDISIEYTGTGSGAGIAQFTTGMVDFGASDAAMSDKEMAAVPGGVILLPMTAGEVVLTYNLEGITDLKLSREAYAGIFLGTIKKWNDPAIAATNPELHLPDEPIAAIHRAEGSGTTYCFTNHLSAISPAWKKGPGVGKTVKWPSGVGGNGNNEVTALVERTPGAIGYIEFGYAMSNSLPMALLQNKAGKFVKPGPESGAAALASVKLPPDLRAWAPDPAGADSYPIVTYTWLLVHPVYHNAAMGRALKDAIVYGLTTGQKISQELGYIPLPEPVVKRVLAAADSIKVGN